uniref:SANT domain-containing protein n=1 Tax=Globodera pallida TaxID=36090 RepID=A0A183BPB3_GLOPA
MSMKGVIRKPLRRLNIQTIQNATEIQTSLNQNVASVAANASSSIDEVPAVANGVKIFNKDKTQNRNVETMFPMTEENESDVPENKKSQENKDKNNREFAASMINAIERHVAETVNRTKIINGDSNTFGQPIENEKLFKQPKHEQNDLKQNGLITIDNSTAGKDGDNSDDSESVEKYANKSENNKKSNDDNEDESKMLEKRQSPIGGSRKLILLKDDVGETPKRRKNGKKRRGQKKHQKTGTPIQQLVTTEDIFGTGDVNLPKIEQVEPANEQEEAIVDEELPPSQSELPPFDAFPSPPPSNQRRNSQIGTQLAQLPDYGRALNMNSIKNITTKTTTLKPPPPTTTTTSTMASVPNEADDHTEIISGERESTTTMEVPKPTTPSKVPRRRQFEKVVPVPREQQQQQQQQLVPPRRVFPSRHGQTTATPAAAAGPINGGLPDEETDSSPFDAERAQFLEHTWHSKQEPTTSRKRVFVETEEQQTTSTNDEDENTEQTTSTTPILIANSRRQNRVERIESRFEAKSPFEKEIRRKPIIDVSFPKQQSSDDEENNMLTFCSKRAAIRDSANMVIACAGEDGQVWTPLRCPPGTDCLPAADSTFQICCPVAIGRRR